MGCAAVAWLTGGRSLGCLGTTTGYPLESLQDWAFQASGVAESYEGFYRSGLKRCEHRVPVEMALFFTRAPDIETVFGDPDVDLNVGGWQPAGDCIILLDFGWRPAHGSWRMSSQVHYQFVDADPEQENDSPTDHVPDVMGLECLWRLNGRVLNLDAHGGQSHERCYSSATRSRLVCNTPKKEGGKFLLTPVDYQCNHK